MGRESAPGRPEHLGEVVFIWDFSDNNLCLTSIFGGTASIHCCSHFASRNGTFRHSFGQIIPTVRRSPRFSHAQSLPRLQLFILRSRRTARGTVSDDTDALGDDEGHPIGEERARKNREESPPRSAERRVG